MDASEIFAKIFAIGEGIYNAERARKRSRRRSSELKEFGEKVISARAVVAQTAPEKENEGKVSHEPGKPPISGFGAQEPPYIAKESIKAGTACTLCSDEHFSEVSGALAEALRFARSEGLASKEVIRRIRHGRDELNAMERFDLAPEEIVKLPEDEKEVAHWALPESRNLRHMINGIRSVNDLEKTAAKAAETADAFAEKLIKCKPGYFETEQQKELPPEIEALKQMVEERKQETIFFNVPQAREQLISKGFVYTLRPKMRKTGKDTAFTGRWFEKEKIGHVWVDFIKEVKDMGEVEQYLPGSGFGNLEDWWKEAKGSRFLFKVKLLSTTPR